VDIDPEVVFAVLRGAANVVEEAGGAIVGGHTMLDREPKFGLCVFGTVKDERLLQKSTATVGDDLFLTKPIGTGLITTAAKFDEADPVHLAAAIQSMTSSSRTALLCLHQDATAATDVSGFGLIGHVAEVARASRVGARLESPLVPLLPGALQYARDGIVTGGGMRNASYYEALLTVDPDVDLALLTVLNDPQTAGGLLFTASPDREPQLSQRFQDAGLEVSRIGVLTADERITVTS